MIGTANRRQYKINGEFIFSILLDRIPFLCSLWHVRQECFYVYNPRSIHCSSALHHRILKVYEAELSVKRCLPHSIELFYKSLSGNRLKFSKMYFGVKY